MRVATVVGDTPGGAPRDAEGDAYGLLTRSATDDADSALSFPPHSGPGPTSQAGMLHS